MVTTNPNWSTEILWYKTGYAKGKMLLPLKHPIYGRLHCWFCLKLLRICSSFPFFLFFLSCSWLWRQWTIPTNISNSGVGKYRTNPKKYDTPDSSVSEYFSQKMNLKKKFSMLFFLIYPLLLFVLFRWKLKKNIARHICI